MSFPPFLCSHGTCGLVTRVEGILTRDLQREQKGRVNSPQLTTAHPVQGVKCQESGPPAPPPRVSTVKETLWPCAIVPQVWSPYSMSLSLAVWTAGTYRVRFSPQEILILYKGESQKRSGCHMGMWHSLSVCVLRISALGTQKQCLFLL